MLDFHLGIGGIENPGKHLGGISMDGIYWLQKNELIKTGNTGHLPDDSESFPYFDDIVLSAEQVKRVYDHFILIANKLKKTPGFRSSDLDMMERILLCAVKNNSGLSTISD